MATMQDFWNEVDSRIDERLDARLGTVDSSDGSGTPPPSAGGLPIHNNLHHEPALALASDLAIHVITIADADTLGHIKVGSGLVIDGDGVLSVDGGSIEFGFLDLEDVTAPSGYLGQANKVVIVKDDESGLEFHALTAADVGALTQAVADTLYDELGAASDAIAAHVLASNPHPQYLTEAEADALYDELGAASDAIAAHELAANPHPQYLTQAEGDALYSALGHIQAVTAGGTGLTTIAADRMWYSTASDTIGTTALTAFARTLLDDVDAAAVRATLGLVAGGTGDIWVNITGDTMTGNLVIQKASATLTVEATGSTNAILHFDSPVGQQSQLNFDAGGASRWILNKDGSAEVGGNVGSNLAILARNDAGTSTIFTPLFFERETGYVGVNRTTAASVEYQLDVFGPIRADSGTGGTVVLSRADSSIGSNDLIGKIEYLNNLDDALTSKFIFAEIEARAGRAATTNAPTGRVHVKTTGTAAGTDPVDRFVTGCIQTLTDAATNLFDVTLNAGEMAGGSIIWTIIASNGTDQQSYTGITTYAVVNKAGTYTSQITHNTNNDAKAVSSGTLTASWTVLNATNSVTIRVTPTGSLTETTYQITYSIFSNSPQSISVRAIA